ncbi:MAG: hypothetical protein ACM3SY_01320 [Candidatus Omnitrophota bacterium]
MEHDTNQDNSHQVKPLKIQNGIFVAGHPRSGTSLVCKLLETAGVHFPSDLAADQYNADGYFELSSAKELEKKLIDEAMTPSNIIELNAIIRILNEGNGLTGLKIVHIPALFFYKHLCKNMRVVFVYRNPSDVYSSMLRRGISSFKLDWFRNNNAIISGFENIPKSIIISYEFLINGKGETIKKAFKKLGFNVNPEAIKEDSRTQENSGVVLTQDEKRLYDYLKKLEKKSWK